MKVMRGREASLRVSGILVCCLLLVSVFTPSTAQAETRLIVRDSLGLPGINLTCLLSGCKVIGGLGDPDGQLFLVTFPSVLDPVTGILRLNLQTSILSVELDQAVSLLGLRAILGEPLDLHLPHLGARGDEVE